MSIKCKICNQEFAKLITSTHLKKHNLLTKDYVELYGKEALSSVSYREQRSKETSGKNNPNYGRTHTAQTREKISKAQTGRLKRTTRVFSEEHKENLRKSLKAREEKYKSGELIRAKTAMTSETKLKISQSMSQYAQKNPSEMKERAAKAIETKKLKNTPGPMTGKNHNEVTKEKLRKYQKDNINQKVQEANSKILERIRSISLELMNNIRNKNLDLKCLKCNTEFSFTKQYFTESKFFKEMCPVCYPRQTNTSIGEGELYDFIKEYAPDAIQNNRSVLNGFEYDIYIPSKKLAFEYNGLYWHSEEVLKQCGYHKHKDLHKLEKSIENQVTLIQVYENEWKLKKDIIKSIVKNKLNAIDRKIYARSCVIKEVDWKTTKDFLEKNHRQGPGRVTAHNLCLFYQEQMVSLMSFSNGNISRKVLDIELDRFCSIVDACVVGAASKLFSHFINNYDASKIISYSDRRYSDGSLYKKLGFEFSENTNPSYWYFKPPSNQLFHRFSLKKNKEDDQELTEYQNRLQQGYHRIWDCGHSKWIWTRK